MLRLSNCKLEVNFEIVFERIVLSKNEHCLIVFLALYNFLIFFSKNEADKQKIFFLKYSHVVTCFVLIQTSFYGPARLVQGYETEIRASTNFLRS